MAPSLPSTALRQSCSSLRTVTRCQRRSLSSQCLRITAATPPSSRSQRRRQASTDASISTPLNPKIVGIVDQISQLTLLETADLVQSLKSRLNIPDISFAPPASAAGTTQAAAAPEEDEPAAPAAAEKSLFTIKLESFEATSKPKIIKEVKSMLGLSLVDSKKFVESAPKVLKEGLPKDEVEKIKTLFEGLGAKITVD